MGRTLYRKTKKIINEVYYSAGFHRFPEDKELELAKKLGVRLEKA